jgi:SAM-dependent methyltransferase
VPLPFNFLETIGISVLNQGPGPMADLLGILSFKALTTAIRLNIFEILGSGSASISELAAAAGADPVGLSHLVGIMKQLGYLKEKRGKIYNTAMTRKWILHDSPFTMVDLFASINDASIRWDYLPDSISKGRPPLLGYQWLDGESSRWTHYHKGLRSTANLLSPSVIKNVRIPSGARTLLDCGGSHGYYCIEFCRHHPGLSGVILDWEPAGSVALQNIRDAGLSERVTFKAGDFLKDSIGNDYDVILLFNVIRILDSEALLALLVKVREALSPGGIVVILDHMGYNPGSRFMGANAYLILLEIYNSTIGRIHKASDVCTMLSEAGFSHIRKKDLSRSPGLSIVQAANG